MKLKRCPNLHYYDSDKYDSCPHCGTAQTQPVSAKPVYEPAPNFQDQPPVQQVQPPVQQPVNDQNNQPPVQQVQPPVQQNVQQQDRSLTAMIRDVSFTGNIEDAKNKSSGSRNDDGVTQIMFEELSDDLAIALLIVTNTSSKGKIYNITDMKSTLGRGDAEHLVTIDLRNDRSVSRGTQAFVIYDPLNKKFFLQTAEGKTLVYRNREMVLTYAELNPYDIIRLGETEMLFLPICCDKFTW